MKRRLFVQSVAASAVFGTLRAFGQETVNNDKPVLVRAGEDRHEDQHFMGGGSIAFDAKVSTADTGGGLFLFENMMTTKGGPGRHMHFDQEEWFYVIEGKYVAEVGDVRYFLNPGDSIYLPRQVAHCWAHISDVVGRMLGAVHPAGTFEQFIDDVRKIEPSTTPQQIAEMLRRHRLQNLGPPIDLATL